ncbi:MULTISPECIES: DUF2500 domain-containing protein [unclassified Symbiopectobacterium]|uniref:DUF2500 domain-containing protein n=1 Tax=unclassified Symbiopectobacterium TaxID=2794573 RepID=UPI002226EF73|nr:MULTISPECIES: DUF2500 domain-containing protein [unclassified Symbiopectobacterium]MCW2476414.1 DUF2500 domain-containing protein [Candidatus Symbiopectobacterium sp. NZEC151]MCW2483613.1 DUF2500 domain-containing protein [Candidatus Symbiopectobacterium sp. NZEC135]MCW2487786.1 DUF2500 domain-containing protein [Candidatus Symbiopectobacterium sp. NZEC127]
MSWEISHWWSLVVSLILFLGWRQFLRQRRQRAADDAAPLRTVEAELVALRAIALARPTRAQPMNPDLPVRYQATFRLLPAGENITCYLSEAQYQALALGMTGRLQVQGSRFVSFVPA